jgi:transcriptional regulator with XRE-family HTH domain
LATTTTVGQLIRSKRQAAGQTQPQVAVPAGISIGTWSRVESGKLIPEPRNLAAIAHAAGVTAEQLEEVGQHEAAGLVRARHDRQPDRAPTSIGVAINNFQMEALDIGWSVAIRHPDRDTYLIELRRDKPA